MDCASFISLHRQLLADERAAEVDQSEQLLGGCSVGQLCRRGVCLSGLSLLERRTGLYGRSVLTLGPPPSGAADATLPPGHSFRPGDIVQLTSAATVSYSVDSSTVQAVVTAVSSRKLVLALDGDDFDSDQDDCTLFRVVKVASDITYRRLIGALDSLEQSCSLSSTLCRVLFGEVPVPVSCPTMPPRLLDSSGELRWCNPNLDASQRAAVIFAVQQPTLAIIHGPPGTGKTTTVVEAIVQHLRLGSRVLVCAPSNTAVDNLLLRLSAVAELGAVSSAALLRLGHPARIDAALQRFSLDAHVQLAPEANIVLDVRDDLDVVLRRGRGRARALELSQLRAELRQRELRLTCDVLRRARVVLSTLTGVSADGPLRQLPDDHFQLVVIDECSQALEAACWLAVPRAGKLLLSGDHQQLPPTIMSASAARRGLSVSLMERCVQRLGDAVVRFLSTQYRMHELIQRWSSRTFYSDQLQASPSVATHRLCDLPCVRATDDTTCPLLLIDTCGCDLWEMKQQPDDADVAGSCGNEGEADIIVSHVRSLLSAGLLAAHVGVITPYSMQVGLIGSRLRSAGFGAVEVNSVDGYQGREKEAIVVSMVRCNRRGEVGFLSERRRINVAVTRARRQLTVVCDTVTVGHDEVIRSLLDHMIECGEVRSAAVYDTDIGPVSGPPAVSNNSTDKPAKTVSKSRPGTSSKKTTGQKNAADKGVCTGFDGSTKLVAAPAIEPSLDEDSGDCDQRIESLRNQLEAFQMGSLNEMEFSTDLSSFERRKVHEMADELGLIHGSCGEGRRRRIVIGKHESLTAESQMDELPATLSIIAHNSDKVQIDVTSPAAGESSGGSTAVEDSVPCTICAVCGKAIPDPNLELHKLRCRALTSNSSREGGAVKSKSARQKKKARKKGRCAAEKGSDDEDEALLASLTAMNSRCNATTGGAACRSTSTTLLQTCAHCRLVYCLQHHMAEEHGCGMAARTAARREFSCRSAFRAAAAASRSQQTRHGQLQRALTAKLTQMERKRQPKASGNK